MDPGLHNLHQAIQSEIAHLSAEQLRSHPAGKWCIAEILEHLYLTYTGTIKGCERVLAEGKPLARAATWADRGKTFVVVGLGYLPSGRQAPSTARPKGLPAEKVLAEILPKILEMDQILGQCEQKFGRGKLLDHPILGPLTGAEWRKFHLVHGLHHAKQIRRCDSYSALGLKAKKESAGSPGARSIS
jgi:hypothetical protein